MPFLTSHRGPAVRSRATTSTTADPVSPRRHGLFTSRHRPRSPHHGPHVLTPAAAEVDPALAGTHTQRSPGTFKRRGLFSSGRRQRRRGPVVAPTNGAAPVREPVVGSSRAHRRERRGLLGGGRTRGVTAEEAQRGHVGVGDKIGGAWQRVKGAVAGRPEEEVAGARRMHGIPERRSKRSRLFGGLRH